MNPWIQLFNIIAPQVFQIIRGQQQANPTATYAENLRAAGVKLDGEYAQLLADMAKAVEEGAVPRAPTNS